MKIINVLLFFILCSFATTNAQAETKRDCSQVKKLHEKLLCKAGKTTSYGDNEKKDCSQHSSKTFAGLSDKLRCKKGLKPRENIFKVLRLKKEKNDDTTVIEVKSCDDYTTKTFVGLAKRMKCKLND